jgi:hypothetical protein
MAARSNILSVEELMQARLRARLSRFFMMRDGALLSGKLLAPAIFIAALAAGLPAASPPAAAQCSVFSHHPCLPYNYPRSYPCGLNVRPGCMPDILLPLNQVPVIHVDGHDGPPEPIDRDHPADRLDQMGALFSKCLQLPNGDKVREGMRVTLKLAFKRDGALMAPPRITYTTHEAPADIQQAYRDAAMEMINHCTPLPITAGLGNAIAGRPFVIPIIESRHEKTGDNAGHSPADAPGAANSP